MANQPSTADQLNALTSASSQTTRNRQRYPWEFNSSYSVSNGVPGILMSINPNSVNFSQSKRISTGRKTIGGTVFFHWSDSTGRNLDPLILNIRGETGPISGLGSTADLQKQTTIITQGGKVHPKSLANGQNWARLYTLTAQPQIDPVTLVPNIFTIKYRSLIFPLVTFSGFYNSVLTFEDSAMSPFSKTYNVQFTVTKVDPDILILTNLIGSLNAGVDLSAQQITAGEPSAGPTVT